MGAAFAVLAAILASLTLAATTTSPASEWFGTVALSCGALSATLGLGPARDRSTVARALGLLAGSAGALIALAILAQALALVGRGFRYGGPSLSL